MSNSGVTVPTTWTLPTEPYRAYYRTTGITDDSGAWTLIDYSGNISGAVGANAIQFMLEFRTIGAFSQPNRIYNVGVTYEDNTTDSHFQPSAGKSSVTLKQFAWRHSTAFGVSYGSVIPNLRIRLYDAVGGGLVLDDTSAAPLLGTFQKSTDNGGTWGDFTTVDKINDNTYIRYTPTNLGDNIKVRALLTLN